MRLLRRFTLFATLALMLASCSAPPEQRTSPTPLTRESATLRDLSQDEAAGGHTLRKHVGRTDDDLRQRLARERNISAASTYTDRPTAEQAVGAALQQDRSQITAWLNRSGGHPNLVLDYHAPQPVGRTLRRGASTPEPCNQATIVLKYDGASDYHVLTSYPECR
ncbi:MAG: hypothetical protein H0X25_05435 [Acidobacteriales bacterium]|nr:hypothetical protein [Terriglobales bacterium]